MLDGYVTRVNKQYKSAVQVLSSHIMKMSALKQKVIPYQPFELTSLTMSVFFQYQKYICCLSITM